MLFQIRDLTMIYGERKVLDLPLMDFEEGIIYALQGPNGSGKTTLLEILSLLIPPTTGSVFYNQRRIDSVGGNMTGLRREIVMVQQNPVLFTTTVYKNLEFGLKIRGIPSMERERMIGESLDLVGMQAFASAQAHRLSGGETQRVAIARALVCSPKVMFFDEPTSNVDVENQIAIERIIREINTQKNISVIFTTHNLSQAARLSHKTIFLFEGRKVPSIYENIFTGMVLPSETGAKSCLIQEGLTLSIETTKTGPVKLSIDPQKIQILQAQETRSKTNVFQGRLIQLADEQHLVRAVVDVGVPLNILLPKKDLGNKGLMVGETVKILCPEEAIQII
ncbi:MAG: ATP-binding cassette domain-containing protein [Proteobacteria bacterium]|nr:ATP-binding cassette domain-containing protein [Pseudomonadota bacterium]